MFTVSEVDKGHKTGFVKSHNDNKVIHGEQLCHFCFSFPFFPCSKLFHLWVDPISEGLCHPSSKKEVLKVVAICNKNFTRKWFSSVCPKQPNQKTQQKLCPPENADSKKVIPVSHLASPRGDKNGKENMEVHSVPIHLNCCPFEKFYSINMHTLPYFFGYETECFCQCSIQEFLSHFSQPFQPSRISKQFQPINSIMKLFCIFLWPSLMLLLFRTSISWS